MNIKEIESGFEEAFQKLGTTAIRESCKLMYLAGLADAAIEADNKGPVGTGETQETIMTYLEKTYNCGK
jgi:hypothetical protein